MPTSNIASLDIQRCGINAIEMTKILKELSKNSSIVYLDISCNLRKTDDNLVEFAEELGKFLKKSSLKYLGFAGCGCEKGSVGCDITHLKDRCTHSGTELGFPICRCCYCHSLNEPKGKKESGCINFDLSDVILQMKDIFAESKNVF